VQKATSFDTFFEAFRPEPLSEGNGLDEFYRETIAARIGEGEVSPLDDIYDACRRPSEQNSHLLLGHFGCGKSTELNKLAVRLEQDGQPVFIINCQQELNGSDVSVWDLMILATDGLCQIANNKNISVEDELLDEIYDYLHADVETTTDIVDLEDITVDGGVDASTPRIFKIAKAFVDFKAQMKSNTTTRTTIRKKMDTQASIWLEYIHKLSHTISLALNGKQPVLIFEDLEKISLSVERFFSIFENLVLAQLSFPAIYTFPISLSYEPRFGNLDFYYSCHILPMIKVRERNGDRASGVDTIKDIVAKRTELSLFDDDVLEDLIMRTGGSLRDLFARLQSASRRAAHQKRTTISQGDIDKSLLELRSDLVRRIEQPAYDKLAELHRGEKRAIRDRPFLLEMTHAHVVLEYNGERWNDLHPMITEFLTELGYLSAS
jgi:hypothetical protein